jgi:DNA repair protein SbcC/Rad50
MRIKHLARPLSRLFGTAPEDSPGAPDSIAALDPPPPRLAAAAPEGGDETLRAAAIGKLVDGESLRTLAGLSTGAASGVPASLERAAQERLAQLIDAGTLEFETLRAPPVNISALLAVVGYSSDPERLPRTLASIDEAERRALVLGGSSSRIRQLAAHSVSDPIELRQLLRQLHGKDKNVYKIIREKCDALNAAEQTIDKARNEAIRACESLERDAHRIYEAVYEPTLRHFHTRWQALEVHAAPDVRERAARAIERCEEIVAEHHQRVGQAAAEAEARAAREAERAETMRLTELESARTREEAERAAVAARG